jgi:hypothetical protein
MAKHANNDSVSHIMFFIWKMDHLKDLNIHVIQVSHVHGLLEAKK